MGDWQEDCARDPQGNRRRRLSQGRSAKLTSMNYSALAECFHAPTIQLASVAGPATSLPTNMT